MRDLVFLAVTIGFFAICAAYIGACARIVDRQTANERGRGAADAEDADAELLGGRR